jgi:predicted GH43/DUF377 family glycosyl hydrolase
VRRIVQLLLPVWALAGVLLVYAIVAAPRIHAQASTATDDPDHYVGLYNYYRTAAGGTSYQIGAARSTDGRTWTRWVEPAISAGTGWEANHVAHPTVVEVDGVLYCYYSGYGGGAKAIGLAISYDGGQTWTKSPRNPVLPATAGWENSQVYIPSVLYDRDEPDASKRWKMWFTGNGGAGIGYAYSADGITWTKFAGNPVLTPAGSGWESALVSPNSVSRVGSKFYFFYTGYGSTSGNAQSGLVTFTDPTGPYARAANNPILRSDGKTTALTAAVKAGDTTLTVGNADLFPRNAPVWVFNGNAHFLTRVAKRLSSTSLQITDVAPIAVASGGTVRSAAYNSVDLIHPTYDGGWQASFTGFQVGASPNGVAEVTMLAYAKHADSVWRVDYGAGLLIPFSAPESTGVAASTENLWQVDLYDSDDRFDPAGGP